MSVVQSFLSAASVPSGVGGWVVTILIAGIGGSAFGAFVNGILQRRKTAADAQHMSANAADIFARRLVDVQEKWANSQAEIAILRAHIARLEMAMRAAGIDVPELPPVRTDPVSQGV